MEEEILKKMEEQDKKLQEIYRSVEKMRKFFFWTVVISVVFIVLPLIALVFIIPQFLSSFDLNSLGI
jgi:type IV secretory pathway component VirB8